MTRSTRAFSLWGSLFLAIILTACDLGASPTPLPPPTLARTRIPPTHTPSVKARAEIPSTAASTPQPSAASASASQPTAVPEATQPAPTAVPPTSAPPPTTVPPTSAPAPLVRSAQNYFGASTNGELIYDNQASSLAVVAGVQMVRTSINWRATEKSKGEYAWAGTDDAFKKLADHNLDPLVLILDNPAWASNTICGPVNDLPAFEEFLRTLAARYPNVRHWGLYNEPDHAHGPENTSGGCFGGGDLNGNGKPDFEDYAGMLRIARSAIHQGNPNAQLMMGAVAYDNFDEATAPPTYPGAGKGGVFNYHFLDQLMGYMQANPLPDGGKYFDLLGFNFYAIYGPYWQRQAPGFGLVAKANALRRLMQKYGINAGLLVSETGDDSVRVGADGQSQYAVKTFTRGLAAGISNVIWWTWQDFPDNAPPPSNTWKYGLVDQNMTPKPSYSAYQTMSHTLTGATFSQEVTVQGGEGYLFNKNGAGIAVIWSSTDAPVTISFAGKNVQVTDMYGVPRNIGDGSNEDQDASQGNIGIQVGPSPSYIQLTTP